MLMRHRGRQQFLTAAVSRRDAWQYVEVAAKIRWAFNHPDAGGVFRDTTARSVRAAHPDDVAVHRGRGPTPHRASAGNTQRQMTSARAGGTRIRPSGTSLAEEPQALHFGLDDIQWREGIQLLVCCRSTGVAASAPSCSSLPVTCKNSGFLPPICAVDEMRGWHCTAEAGMYELHYRRTKHRSPQDGSHRGGKDA